MAHHDTMHTAVYDAATGLMGPLMKALAIIIGALVNLWVLIFCIFILGSV